MSYLVFIHGLIGPFIDSRVTAELGSTAAVIAPDLHGYGDFAGGQETAITIDNQVDFVRSEIQRSVPNDVPIHLVGHSVGAVIAARYIDRFSTSVESFINVEGNFTLRDAFWSQQIARKSIDEVKRLFDRDRLDPVSWLREAGVEPTPDRLKAASEALTYQPATTIRSVARAVVEFTADPGYTKMLRRVFAQVPVHLVAGSRSRPSWDVPTWALNAATSYTELPGVGHMVMLEDPEMFGKYLCELLQGGSVAVK